MVHIVNARSYILRIFCGIETCDMPVVDDDGIVRSMSRKVVFSYGPPFTKRPPDRLKKNRIES